MAVRGQHLQQTVAEIAEEDAADVLAPVGDARAGTTPADVYGAAWGRVLADVDPWALVVSGTPTIELPDGIPDIA